MMSGLMVLLGGAAHAEAPKHECSKAETRKTRAAAEKAVQAKDYKKAVSLLESFLAACSGIADRVESGWVASDLAAAYEKTGQFLECQRLMGPMSHPRSGVQETGNEKLIKAIEYNFIRCGKALDAQYAALKRGGCGLMVGDAIATAPVPEALMPEGAKTACLALVPGTRAKEAADDDVTCPKLALFWKGAKPTRERQDLTSSGDHDALTDESECCNLSEISAGTVAGRNLVRVYGHGSPCGGGTADTASDVFYEWKGTTLRSTIDASVTYH